MADRDAATPDLTAGVSADSIPDGSSLLGKVGKKDVLLVRTAGRLFAVGAPLHPLSRAVERGARRSGRRFVARCITRVSTSRLARPSVLRRSIRSAAGGSTSATARSSSVSGPILLRRHRAPRARTRPRSSSSGAVRRAWRQPTC